MADLVVFPSAWARDRAAINNKNLAVIPNAPLNDFIVERESYKLGNPIRLVTHHWSNNTMKGFDVYEELDNFCKKSGKFTFTFIGRKPDDVLLQNHIPPQDIQGLVDLLPKHDIYITASRQEAGANHVLEAMGMGLPVLYHSDGGSINEYCNERGLAYDNARMLIEILEKEDLHNMLKMPKYTYSSDIMAKSYVDMIECVFASQYKH
jgi:predicted glycosyltransferase